MKTQIEFINECTAWRRERNLFYRRATGMSKFDFDRLMLTGKKAMEAAIDSVVPADLKMSNAPVWSEDYCTKMAG